MDVAGRAVLVTGGGRGLGAALGSELAARGARVVLTARGRDELQATVAAIRAVGGEAHALVSDQADEHAVYPLVGSATALVGPIDVLVLNASALGPTPLRELTETECEDLEAVLETNLVGPFRLIRAVVGSMVLRDSGLVVGVSSDAAVEAYPGWGAYGVSKAALDHLLRIWAAELAETGVRFLSVDPGEMDTAMHEDAMPEADRAVLARPAAVAVQLAELIATSESHASGSRLAASAVVAARA